MKRARRFVLALTTPLLLLIGWEWLATHSTAYSFVFVPLSQAWQALIELLSSGDLLHHLLATLRRMFTGLLAGSVIGIVLGSLMGASRIVDRLVGPLFHAIRQVPLLGWIPLFALWFGAGAVSQVLVVTLASLYPVVIHTYEGVHYVDRRYRETGAVLKLTPLQVYRHVLFASAFPSIVTGITQAVAFAWLSAIGSELLFGESEGLGSLLLFAETSGRGEIMLVCILAIGIAGYLMNETVRLTGRRMLRWQESNSK
jgi:sulfonate transport system permease protein